MMPTLLLTDVLIWLLVFGVLAYARSVIKNPLSRASWGLVFQSKIASASLVVLLLAVVITPARQCAPSPECRAAKPLCQPDHFRTRRCPGSFGL